MIRSADMAHRPLGSTGLEISVVGFGSWAAGGGDYVFGLGAQRDADTVAAIEFAVSRGVNWIDTAAVYGFGHAERVVGQAIASMSERDRPLVITKCGLVQVSSDPDAMPERNLRPEAIGRECRQSLSRLGVDHLDVYLFHWPDTVGTPLAESWGAMQELVQEGLVRFPGLSNFTVDQIEECERIAPVTVVQPPVSLLRRAALRNIVPWCAERDRGVLAYSPMQSGLLTGRLTRERAAQMARDWRRESPEVHEPLLSSCLAAQPALVEVGEAHGVFPGVAAICWVLRQQGVSGAIVGARTQAHVEQLLAAGHVVLSDDDCERLETATARFAEIEPVDPV